MLPQLGIEQKIIPLVVAAMPSGVSVSVVGSWATAAQGYVKWVEDETSSPILVNVAVASPSRPTFSVSNLTFSSSIVVMSRAEADPTGANFNSVCEAVQSVIDAWQSETYQASFTRFDTDDVSIDEISFNGGALPLPEGANVRAEYPFTLSGTYK